MVDSNQKTIIDIKPIWKPTKEQIAKSNIMQYMNYTGKRTGKKFNTYQELYQWSIENIEQFWASLWDYFDIIHSKKFKSVLTGEEIQFTKWFNGAELNFAENLLRYKDNHPAIIYQNEQGISVRLTYQQLYDKVARCADGLKKLGVKKNDCVAAFIPNIPQAIIVMLATTSIGAIWSSCSPEFGLKGVLDRFSQIKPKLLITANGYQYNGKKIDSLKKVKQIAEMIPTIEKIVIIPLMDNFDNHIVNKSITWEELLESKATDIEFAQLPFDHPVYIMFSSGTTGLPKCIVHGAGGTMLQHFKEHILHTNLKRDDIITYYTTCGWMMWNWLVSSLGIGATIFLYDGSPSYPDLDILFKAVEKENITVFGTSPNFLSSCENVDLKPKDNFNLASLKIILTTGSPLSVKNYEYVYRDIKEDVQLSSISGGTDIISCFALGNPILPVYPGEIQCRGLGMKVETTDDNGNIIQNQIGELVCTAPFPSRPVYFYDDPDGRKYSTAYFKHFPGVWRHGDYMKVNSHGGIIIYGRSDATLNPGGVRIGTAEIYGPIEAMKEIKDSIVVGQKIDNSTRIILFVVTAQGYRLDDDLKDRIKQQIRKQISPRHVPAKIIAVEDIPRTLNGKKVELAVTQIIHSQKVPNKEALANPESLGQFANLPELKS